MHNLDDLIYDFESPAHSTRTMLPAQIPSPHYVITSIVLTDRYWRCLHYVCFVSVSIPPVEVHPVGWQDAFHASYHNLNLLSSNFGRSALSQLVAHPPRVTEGMILKDHAARQAPTNLRHHCHWSMLTTELWHISDRDFTRPCFIWTSSRTALLIIAAFLGFALQAP